MAYPANIIQKVIELRNQGKTYGEIRLLLKLNIPKSTLSEWCKKATLPENYTKRIAALNVNNLNKARLIASETNKIKREELLREINNTNLPIAEKVQNREVAKIALAMLCIGEASRTRGNFSLGSSDPRIITLFIELLKKCFTFDLEKIRCTLQCRADQDIESLEAYWLNVTRIPKRLFYKARVDPRTKGKKTKNNNYKGVLKVDYFNTRIQIDLETLAQLLYNQFA
ncbi:MAG: hypothetical protein A3B41_05085 [Candidatus Levybacteria bacterium RIFCSPLOWO2_01_FULL_37_26]|nr:MAG: hypothetical protein A3B41_05085 [Candidatus Levybacteria bacterium RIFCSPLOWO2_01_FULL_37_26]